MTEATKPEIVLYDLACNKNACFSPVVWRIRLILNYKQIPYTTVFLEFPDIAPTLQGFGIVPGEAAAGRYTVPAIHHLATDTYIMDSEPISEYLESNWPEPPLPLKSELGLQVQTTMFAAAAPAMRLSMHSREANILSPRSAEYFRRNYESRLNHSPEEIIHGGKEDEAWAAADEGLRAAEKLLAIHQDEGPFIMGATPTYSDFRIAGPMESARMMDESIFERILKYPGFKRLYEACQPYMETRN